MNYRTLGTTGLRVSELGMGVIFASRVGGDRRQGGGAVRQRLGDVKQGGKIRFTGLGGATAYDLPRVMATGVFDAVLTAHHYSLLWREASMAILPEAERQGMGVIIGSPLQQGALARR